MNTRTYHFVRFLTAALVLALLASACGTKFKVPVTKIETGPTQTVDLQVPMPEEPSSEVEMNLEFIAGQLTLSPGANGSLASGTATFNAPDLEPKMETSGSSYTLRQGEKEFEGFPVFEDEVINEWDLQLADTPMNLNIQAGAYTGRLELGGLSLKNLSISEGGSDFTGTFSEPNHVEMSTLKYSTGGSTMVLKGLANANFEQMTFDSGAGDYTLSFDGDLQRDASVLIESGVSTVNIIVPMGVNAEVTFEGGLTGVNAGDGWAQNDTVYTLSGSGPKLTITVKMGMGTLNLKTG